MRIIISPAKKMKEDTDTLGCRNLPQFLERTDLLLTSLRSMNSEELKKLWKCNDSIASLNEERIRFMELHRCFTPAILAYEGIQYQYMAPEVFSDEEFDYIEEHVRILSGFYGVLRPFDGVTPYRLEMQAKLAVDGKRDLYGFWGDSLAKALFAETECIINLASKEYSQCVSKYLSDDVKFITCTFGEEKDGKVIEKGTMCKMARGEMVRWMAENKVTSPEELKGFVGRNHIYSSEHSTDTNYVYLKKA
ncbi:MAG: peroxide stress protein YaaA [Firmicutes bacterium]|nr:peroxide stress protein YaaA [Bacillota bacterium]